MGATRNPTCADDEIYMWVYSRMVDRRTGEPVPGPQGRWQRQGNRCVGPDDGGAGPQPPRITVEMVMGVARTSAPQPQLHMEPDGESYVNVPNNFYVGSDPVSETLTVLGRAIPVTYTPTGHDWSFGDGQSATGAGIVTASVGQAGAVEHSYRSGGDYSVTVTTAYSVTFTVPGQGQVTPPGTISATSEAYNATIGEIQSVVTEVD